MLGGTGEEAWCNRVAACVLLPDEVLKAFNEATTVQDYRALARRFGVSAEVALHRMYGAHRIDEERYGALLEWSGLVLWTGCFEGCWLLLVVLRPLACVLVG